MNNKYKKMGGMVTLMVVMIMTGIISAIIIPISFHTNNARADVLNGELKEESRANAVSCISSIIMFAEEFGVNSLELFQASEIANCHVHSIELFQNEYAIKLSAQVNNSHTILGARVNIQAKQVVMLEELTNL